MYLSESTLFTSHVFPKHQLTHRKTPHGLPSPKNTVKMSSQRESPPGDGEDGAWPVWRATKQRYCALDHRHLPTLTSTRAVSGDFTDLIIECGEQKYKVHKLVMAASVFFARACLAPFKVCHKSYPQRLEFILTHEQEGEEGVIRLPDDDPEAVKAMIEYLYHGRYGKDLLPQASPCAVDCVCRRPVEISSDSDSDATSSDGSTSDSNNEDASMASTAKSADKRSLKSTASPEKCNKGESSQHLQKQRNSWC